MNPDTVLFDLDFTLCRRRWSPESVLAGAFETVGVPPYVTATDMFGVVGEVPTAESDIDFYTNCLEAAASNVGTTAERAAAVAESYHEAIDYGDVEFVPGAEAALREVGDEYVLGLVTNGSEATQRAKLGALGITEAFETMVFAEPDMGVKPDPYPFERALSALDALPAETMHVGDSLRADVTGANAMGIRSVWLPHDGATLGADDPTPNHTLDSLFDLPALLCGVSSASRDD